MSHPRDPDGHFLGDDPDSKDTPMNPDDHTDQTNDATDDDQARPTRDSQSRRDRIRAELERRLARPAGTRWVSGQEAAEHVGVCWPTLRTLLLDHNIPHLRMGRLWRIDVAVLDDHLRRIAEDGW